ncbi:MAG: 50S ribosomal protein L19e [Thermoproteota archaeon]
MTDLKSQRRLAAQLLKVGETRVWIDPDRIYDVELAITQQEIRNLIDEGAIKKRPKKGVSRVRAQAAHNQRKKGRGRGPGTKTGSSQAKISKKEAWMNKIRSLRKRLRELKNNRTITTSVYRETYKMASSGRFESIADMERHLKKHELWRKR